MIIMYISKIFSIFLVICIVSKISCTGLYDIEMDNIQIEKGLKRSDYGSVLGLLPCGGVGHILRVNLEGYITDKPCQLVAGANPVHGELIFRPRVDAAQVGIRSFFNSSKTEPTLVSDFKPLNMGLQADEIYTITGVVRIGEKHRGQKLTVRREVYNVADNSIIVCGTARIQLHKQ